MQFLKACLIVVVLAIGASCAHTPEPPAAGPAHPATTKTSISEPRRTPTPLTVQEPPPEPADFDALRKLSRPAAEPGTSSRMDAGGEQTVYTCSMHPKVRQGKAGKCPICNMDLMKAQTGGDQ